MSIIILIIIPLAVMIYNSIFQSRFKNSILLKHLYAIILTDFINNIFIRSVEPVYIFKTQPHFYYQITATPQR